MNGSVRASGPTKEQVELKQSGTDQSADKKPLRADKEKRNNLDRIDLCNTASKELFTVNLYH